MQDVEDGKDFLKSGNWTWVDYGTSTTQFGWFIDPPDYLFSIYNNHPLDGAGKNYYYMGHGLVY